VRLCGVFEVAGDNGRWYLDRLVTDDEMSMMGTGGVAVAVKSMTMMHDSKIA